MKGLHSDFALPEVDKKLIDGLMKEAPVGNFTKKMLVKLLVPYLEYELDEE